MENIIIETIAWYKDPQWWAIITALLLGLFGIFQDKIRNIFWKPKIKVNMRLKSPDCHKIAMRNSQTGQFVCDSYYFRFFIENSGNFQMENVEAIITEVSKKEANGEYKKIESFLPLNLVWAHYHNVAMPKIQPHLFKHLDFGHITKSDFANLEYFGIQSSSEVVFQFDLAVIPNHGSHILLPGDYNITIKFAANNLPPVIKRYNFIIADKWNDDERIMLQNNVSIKELK
ncbi:MAG: hypothetical protein PHR57_03220 [Patescibacteria group bacterium]|nr:hypothetical protein [Patescibacteria group bacterium]